MKKILLYITICIILSSCYTLRSKFVLQPRIKGVVYDKETLIPIAYATVTFVQEQKSDIKQFNIGVFSMADDRGVFFLEKVTTKAFYQQLGLILLHRSSTLEVSKFGYITDTISLPSFNFDQKEAVLDTIWLRPIKNIDEPL